MGWLRDMMRGAEPPLKSYAALARRVLQSDAWPDEPRPQARSLAALFSKLDRRQELEWLADRPHVQTAIANATGRSLSDVASVVSDPERPGQTGSHRLQLLPYARDLDLRHESLCPGLPLELGQPSSWYHAWWRVDNRAEAELVGAWHQARGMCRVLQLEKRPLDRQLLALRGPMLLIVDSPDQLDLSMLLEKPDLCATAPFLPQAVNTTRAGLDSLATQFHVLEAPKPEAFVQALLVWVAERLPRDTTFDSAKMLSFVKRAAEHEALPLSLSVLLGLCGVVDELDISDLSQLSLEALARRYIDQRLRQGDSQDPATFSWLRRVGLDVLTGICGRAIVDGTLASSAPRNLEAWLELVPPEYQRGGDLEWMRLALAGTDSPIRPRDIAEAAKHISPGSFRIVRALCQARLLARASGDTLLLNPAWLTQVALRTARKRLLDASALDWGEALLNVHEAAQMLSALMQRTLDQDFGPVESALELETEDEPAASAALEASFVSIGIALLSGIDVPQDLVENVWDEMLRSLVDTEAALPAPRSLFAEAQHLPSSTSACFDVGWFHLAALAISEQLPEGAGRPHELLRPWPLASTPSKLSQLYDNIGSLRPSPPYPPQCSEYSVALVDRIRSSVGQAARTPHQLEWPGVVLDEATHDVLSQESLEALDALPGGVPQLRALSDRRHCDWHSVAVSCWHAWQTAGCPVGRPSYLSSDSEYAGLFWASIPTELLDTCWGTRLPQTSIPLPFEHFGVAQWTAFTNACKTAGVALAHQTAFDVIPQQPASECLDAALEELPEGAIIRLWQRFTDLLHTKTQTLIEEGRTARAFILLEAAPYDSTAVLTQFLQSTLVLRTLKANDMNQLRVWLVRRSTSRKHGWREAYGFLTRIEDTLAPLRASGLRR